MKKFLLLGVLILSATTALAQTKDQLEGIWEGYDGEWLHVSRQLVSLAEAIPADKYTWRPGPGVRSIAEVYLHVAAANFMYAPDLGIMPAPAPQGKGYETSTTDKARIIGQLKQSFDYSRAAVEKMSNADFSKPIKKYGPDASLGDI